ncbi:two-component regulator propeller domain-containing protein [Cecembia sp.]|uniref:ligand-binding sensor domain-containing protein n=1 Tax=Cecembia sp. TaxID=1898110 RepID=UPI0025BE6DE9|nr:two-component regulator propeller domain-containing protein [Cecembia sp.]
MVKKKLILSLLSFCFILAINGQDLGLPFSKYFSSKEYQGGIQNYAISQNQNGLIYVANNFGLLEYDGSNWDRYAIPNSTKIRDIFLESNGRIYIAGQGQLGYFRPNEQGFLEFISWLPKLPLNYQNIEEVWKVFKIYQNYIFCSFKAIFIFDQNGNLKNTIETEAALESFHLSNNQLFFQDSGRGLMKLEQNEAVFLNETALFKNELIAGILEGASGELNIITEKGEAYTWAQQKLKKWDVKDFQNLNKVNLVRRLKDGQFAVGTQYDGLFIFNENGSLQLHLNQDKGLNNNTIISLFEDRAGNLWIGHNNGISLLEFSLPFRLIGPDSGIYGTGYTAKQIDGDLFLGTNIKVSRISISSKEIHAVENSEGQSYSFNIIDNDLLLAHNEGAFFIQNDKAIQINGIKGIWSFLPLIQKPNLVLAGTYNGLAIFEKKDGRYRFLRKLNGFEESSRLILQDDLGNIWMSHGYKGIYKLQLNEDLTGVTSRFYGNKDGLPTNLLNSVFKIGGRIVFTTEYGLYVYNPETDQFEKDFLINPYFEKDFLITSLVEDPVGNIFYIGDREVGILEKQNNGTYQKNNQLFNKIIPFLNDDLQNVSLLRSNEVIFAANEGFIWYRRERNKPLPPPYPVFISAVYLTKPTDSLFFLGKNLDLMDQKFGAESDGNGLVLPYHQGDIRFEYTNSIPNNEGTTQFRVWLEGLEEGFGEWTLKRDRAFTNLKEGKYTFHLQSKDIYEQVAEAKVFTFTVLPPWYRTKFSYLIYFMGLILTFVIAFNRIDKRYQKKTKAITAKQSKELEQKATDLEKSKKEVEKLRTEKLKAELQVKDKELASATMHLLNKNGFIDQTKNQLAAIIKKSKNQEVQNELQKVINSINKNTEKDNDWEQFEIHFDQVHGDFMQRFKREYGNLSPQEIKLSAYLRMNLSTKEMAYLMNISTRGVEISRYRLRKKLNLQRSENLQEFILKF